MPKRVIDFDALWASDKLAACAEWAQAEYAWLYGLADASGSFELTNLRVIWGRVAAVRKNLTLQRLTEIFEEFTKRGLLFTWEQNGKRYGHWTGSDVPGRLPPPSWRMRLERLAPPVPRDQLAAYLARYGGHTVAPSAGSADGTPASLDETANRTTDEFVNKSIAGTNPQLELKLGIDPAQAQEWDEDLDWEKRRKEIQVCSVASPNIHSSSEARIGSAAPPIIGWDGDLALARSSTQAIPRRNEMIEQMFSVYEAERGSLPPANRFSGEIRRQCLRRLADGLTLEDFRAAVRRAAATPFLTGAGGRGWCASFDWLVANEENVRKVLAGRYEPPAQRGGAWGHGNQRTSAPNVAAASGAWAGAGPVASAVGARVKAATLERIRAREELRVTAVTGTDKEKAS